jgi:hypothetical protein
MQILRPYLKNILLIGLTAWLIARAVDAMDNEVNGVSILSSVAPEAEA